MNPFNPLSIVQSTFESADVQHELKELVEIIRAYDIYDFLRRLSALNLQKENTYRKKLSVLSEAELSVESLRKIQ